VTIALWMMVARASPPPELRAWLAALPTHFDCTLDWSEAELAELQASSARERAGVLQRWAATEWRRIFASSRPLPFDTSFAHFQWALCAVWSRSFQMPCAPPHCHEGGVWRVLAPVADLLNQPALDIPVGARLEIRAASGAPELWHTTSAELIQLQPQLQLLRAPMNDTPVELLDDALLLRAARRLETGEELTLDYGGRPNAELLTTHGFALVGNRHETLPLSLTPLADDPLAQVKTQILEAGNLSAPYLLSADALETDSDLLVALRLLSASAVELKGYALAFHGKPISAANERRWRRMLERRVLILLETREAHTTEESDRRAIQAGAKSAGSTRRWFSLLTRHAEKLMLAEVLRSLERLASTARESDDSDILEPVGRVSPIEVRHDEL